jgi:GMP synthase-like glutamine amidotransferase
MHKGSIKIAVIDLYKGVPNQGLRSLRDLLTQAGRERPDLAVAFDFFDTRGRGELPDMTHDIFISTGGPGSPFDGQGEAWEKNYFRLLDRIYTHNQNRSAEKKYVFFICHSFQMMARFFEIAQVVRRHSEAFGIFPVHKTGAGKTDPLLQGLDDPFYDGDFRNWQVIQPNHKRLKSLGARILCIEKIRPHVPYERAVMMVRISPEIVGTQFHPESDPASIRWQLSQPEKKKRILEKWGMDKYRQMQALARENGALVRTRNIILPRFFRLSFQALRPCAGHCLPAAHVGAGRAGASSAQLQAGLRE